MNPRELILINLKRHDIDYMKRVNEALNHADDALRKKDVLFARQIIDIIFLDSKTNRLINSTQELQFIVCLTEFFTRDDPARLALFFNIFEVGKNSRKFILIKFIIISIAIQNSAALNSIGTYLLDPAMKDIRVAADLNRLLINEITYYASNSLDKLKALPTISPLFTNSLCLIFAEIYKDDQLPTKIIGELITDFMTLSPFIYIFSIPTHIEVGAFLLGTFFRWTILSELQDEGGSFSKLHLKILECLSSVDMKAPSKPIVYTKFLENIIDQIHRAAKIKDPEKVQRSMEKFAQLIQISKKFLYGNIPLLMERLKSLPKNPLMELILRHN